MNLKDLRRPILRWAMGWPGDSTGLGPPRLPPAKMIEIARESKREISELIPVHPAGKIYRKKPAIPISCEPHPAFDIPVAPQTPTYLARVPHGRVVGPTVAVLTSSDRMIADVSLDWGHPGMEHFAYRRFRLPRCTDYQGSALVLACTGADTFFHWITDALPRLEIAARAKGIQWRPDFWIVNSLLPSFVRESLSFWKIPLERVIALDRQPHIRCKELWVPSLPCEASSGDPPSWVTKYLLEITGNLPSPQPVKRTAQVIWIDRSRRGSRSLPLAPKHKSFLKKRGVTILSLEKLQFTQQIAFFREAQHIIGPHGAGFVNQIFSAKPKVLEFFPKDYVNACYYALNQNVGGFYSYHVANQWNNIEFFLDLAADFILS